MFHFKSGSLSRRFCSQPRSRLRNIHYKAVLGSGKGNHHHDGEKRRALGSDSFIDATWAFFRWIWHLLGISFIFFILLQVLFVGQIPMLCFVTNNLPIRFFSYLCLTHKPFGDRWFNQISASSLCFVRLHHRKRGRSWTFRAWPSTTQSWGSPTSWNTWAKRQAGGSAGSIAVPPWPYHHKPIWGPPP